MTVLPALPLAVRETPVFSVFTHALQDLALRLLLVMGSGQLPMKPDVRLGQLPMLAREERLGTADSGAWVNMTFSPE